MTNIQQRVTSSPAASIERLAYHEGQRRVIDERRRFNVIVCGRRWGKTRMGVDLAAASAMEGKSVGWFAPNYKYLQEAWYGLVGICREHIARSSKTDKRIELMTGGVIEFWTLEDEDAGRSRAYHRVIIDEAAKAPYLEAAWTKAIRPTLADHLGDAWFLSTPMGRNYFWQLSNKAHDSGEWRTWSMPTSTNPHIDKAEIEDARRDLPEAAFRQEFLAAFLEDDGLVFRNVRGCLAQPPPGPQGGRRYVMGVDWAQAHDWTVLTVMDVKDRQVVEIDRFNQIEWAFQRSRLVAMCQRWGVRYVLAEHNSIGGPNIEALNRDPEMSEVTVIGFETTNPSKTAAVQALMLAFERGEIAIPEDPVLLAELEAFEAKRLPSGKWQYSAPDGMHDDTVISLMLAYRAALSGGVELVSQPTHASAFAGMGDDWSGEGSRWKRW